MKPKILIVGLGKVGMILKEIISNSSDFTFFGAVDKHEKTAEYSSIKDVDLEKVDALIDFSSGEAVPEIVNCVVEKNKTLKMIIASSGWHEQQKKIKTIVKENSLFFMYGANFSIGTAVVMRAAELVSEMLQGQGYSAGVIDLHHNQKIDSNSGTAITIGEGIVRSSKDYKEIVTGEVEGGLKPEQVHVQGLRIGKNKGSHEIIFDNEFEEITLIQRTRDRGEYANGAFMATRWMLKVEKPGYYIFQDYLKSEVYKTKSN